ncbi:MAG: tRNA pseudouridine(55) synthase TruB [Deltaproteobacteria bacterium]|nr:tRNA pseudouridine(55) synthase TruB [Deltaproteobacteria bacterium]
MSGAPSFRAADVPDGLLIVDKPARLGSFDVIRRLRPLLGRRRKLGFIGTLDPFATGVLPLCLGEATKLADALGDGEKEYEADLALGAATDTGDVTGRVTATAALPALGADELARARDAFVGEILQVPPMYSAVHVGGERLYEKARRGEVVERAARSVTIHALEVTGLTLDRLRLRVVCSKGTYVRVLGEELAHRLGTEGHLASLRRIRSGGFAIERSASLGELLGQSPAAAITRASIPLDALEFPGRRALDLSAAGARAVAHGAAIGMDGLEGEVAPPGDGERVLLRRAGHLVALAVGTSEARSVLRPTRLLLRPDLEA